MIHTGQATDIADAPTTGQAPHGPGIGHMLSNAGDLAWNVAGYMPGGHLGAFGLLAVAGGAGYWKIHLDKTSGPTSKKDKHAREGFADKKELRAFLSADSLRERAATLRPSLHGVPLREITPLAVGL